MSDAPPDRFFPPTFAQDSDTLRTLHQWSDQELEARLLICEQRRETLLLARGDGDDEQVNEWIHRNDVLLTRLFRQQRTRLGKMLPVKIELPTFEELDGLQYVRAWSDEDLVVHLQLCQQREHGFAQHTHLQDRPDMQRMMHVNAEICRIIKAERERRLHA